MPPRSSCAPAVRTALIALSVSLWPTAEVRRGGDTWLRDEDATALVRLLGTTGEQDWRTTGVGALKTDRHDTRLSLIGYTGDDEQTADDPQAAMETVVMGMLAQLEAALLADPILSGAVGRPGSAQIVAWELTDTTEDESLMGRLAEVVVTVHVEATI